MLQDETESSATPLQTKSSVLWTTEVVRPPVRGSDT